LDDEYNLDEKNSVNMNGYKMNVKVSRLDLEVVNKLHDKPPKVVLNTLHE